MTKDLLPNAPQINLNTTQETVPIPVADVDYVIVDVVPESAAHTTYRAEVVFKISPGDTWRSFPSVVTLSQASPNSASTYGLLGASGAIFFGVRITTVQGAAGNGHVHATGFRATNQTARIG